MMMNSSLAAVIAVVGAVFILAVSCYAHSQSVGNIYAGALESAKADARVDTLVKDGVCWSRRGNTEAQYWAIGVGVVALVAAFMMNRSRR